MNKRTFLHIPPVTYPTRSQKLARQFAGAVLSPLYWLLAYRYPTPGLDFYCRAARFGFDLLRAPISPGWAYQFIFNPMDSTRYFEFDFAWRVLAALPIQNYLDVSSPRLFPLILLRAKRAMRAELINPDADDLTTTEKLVRAAGLGARCRLHNQTIDTVDFAPGSFDAITSISVVEHIADDRAAIGKMWQLLRPGGRLLITVPCARETSEQYIDHNEYRVLETDAFGFVFFQRFYDADLLQGKIFSATGAPARSAIYGEKIQGTFQRNAAQKRAEYLTRYPFWREPYMMSNEYHYFDSLDELPGEGVIGLEFIKP